MDGFNAYFSPMFASLIPLLGALALLIVGLIVANFVANKVGAVLKKNESVKSFVNRITDGDQNEAKIIEVVVKVIFYVLVIFVVGTVLEMVGLTSMTGPLNRFLDPIFSFIPKLFAALLIFVVGWIIATLAKMLVQQAGQRFGLDSRVEQGEGAVSLTNALADIAFWVIMFFFLPMILSALQLTGILEPLQSMIDKILSALPNILTAAIILFVGWFVAKKLKEATASILTSVGVDRLMKQDANDTLKISEILSLLVYILILIPVIAASFHVVGLEALAQPVTNMIDQILNYVPVAFAAGVIVFLAYFLGRIVGDIITGVIAKLNVENGMKKMGLIGEASDLNVGKIVGQLVYVLIVFFAALQAADILGFSQIAVLANQFIVLFGKILLGLIIIGLGLFASQFVASVIEKQEIKSSKLLAMIARVATVFLSLFMGLRQMGVADNIIDMAFGFTIGAVAVAAALAFGLGGRDEAARFLAKVRSEEVLEDLADPEQSADHSDQ